MATDKELELSKFFILEAPEKVPFPKLLDIDKNIYKNSEDYEKCSCTPTRKIITNCRLLWKDEPSAHTSHLVPNWLSGHILTIIWPYSVVNTSGSSLINTPTNPDITCYIIIIVLCCNIASNCSWRVPQFKYKPFCII